MINLFSPIKHKFLKFGNVSIDNYAFRMHYRVTSIMFLVFTMLVTSKQFFGDPIHCISNGKTNNKAAINSYCWIYGTYTLKSQQHHVMISAGVGPGTEKDDHVYHTYYQWVCFVLLGQSLMFYIPRYLWKSWEGGRLKALAGDLNSPLITKNWLQFRRGELIKYLREADIHTHNMYAFKYAFCEFLNFVNVVGQIFLLDSFLGGAFRNYGSTVAAFSHVPRLPSDMMDFASVNPMDQFFPKLTKCWLKSYGSTGTLEFRDYLCILPLNVVNEKIFLFLWFWLIIIACVSSLAVVFRILVLSQRSFRTFMIAGQLRNVNYDTITRVVNRFDCGHWFVLYLLSKNMNPIIYEDLILELSHEPDDNKFKI